MQVESVVVEAMFRRSHSFAHLFASQRSACSVVPLAKLCFAPLTPSLTLLTPLLALLTPSPAPVTPLHKVSRL